MFNIKNPLYLPGKYHSRALQSDFSDRQSRLYCDVTMNDLYEGGGLVMGPQKWTVADAKAKFSEIVERALTEGPQTIMRNGRKAAVVVGAVEWERKTKRVGNLAEFFAGSPLRGSGLKVRRLRGAASEDQSAIYLLDTNVDTNAVSDGPSPAPIQVSSPGRNRR